jgi:hypothetical protein
MFIILVVAPLSIYFDQQSTLYEKYIILKLSWSRLYMFIKVS